MSNEIRSQIRLSLANGPLDDSYASGSMQMDQAVARLVRNTQSIPNVDTALDTGSIITPGMAVFKNLSETPGDEIEIGKFTGGTLYPLMKLEVGDEQVIRLAVANAELYAISNQAGGVMLFYIIYNA